ncbi:MAG: response regulator [Bacilli bacterium]|nr:response regulator [Bacilli bacterium]
MNIVWLQISSLIYMTILLILYYSSKRIVTTETKIFKGIMLANEIGLLIDLSCFYTVSHAKTMPILAAISTRLLLVYYLVYVSLFTIYLFFVVRTNSMQKEKRHKMMKMFLAFVGVAIFIACILPMKYHNSDGAIYSYGISVDFMYYVYSLIIVMWVICIILNFKRIIKKKLLPIIILVVLGTIVGIIQKSYPELLLMTAADTIVTFIMYFTIENPDVKLIQELNIARDRADKANDAKTEFLSSMSHEIRTPLNAIDGFSQLILEEDNINTIKDEAKDIMAASKNLLEIVNGILDISKIEANKLEIVNVEYEPAKIFDEVGKLAKSRIGSKPVMFKEHIAPDLPDYLDGDYTRVKQITLNLLTNAVKYTKDGYVDYSVRCVKQDDVCRLIIMVKDTGIGIKTENIDKLFNKFERFDKENNITIEGTGLGLAITKKLVDLMGGKIIADSRYGVGSIFAVVIDQKIVNKVKQHEVVEKENRTTFDFARVLVVDDNKINLKVASKLLDLYHIKADLVESGFECIEKIKSGTIYNLILMDDMMPQMSGTETFKKLKEIDNFNVPVIALTANAISGMKEKYLNEGFNDYISKPIDKKELERVLNTYLN